MKTYNDLPGTPGWHTRRAGCFNASDAPAMLGCSPHETRSQLLARLHTGVDREFSSYAQEWVIDPGHDYEAKAQPLAEEIIGEYLSPVGGSEEFGLSRPLGASFDGITMLGDVVWEHKRMNEELRKLELEDVPENLAKCYRVQLEQQLLVSGAERALFMATRWKDDTCEEVRRCWYTGDPELRAEILAGWKQFDADLAAYVPSTSPIPEKIIAEPVETLPAPVVQVSGQLALTDNFKVFETRLRDFLEHRLIRQPKTDEDFVNLDAQIKAMKQARESLKAAEAQMLAQVEPIDQAKKTKDMLDKLLQQNVSMAESLLSAEKERRKGEIVASGVASLKAHIDHLNKRLAGNYIGSIPADFGGCIRGLKSLASMEDKVATELARAKIAANEVADRVGINLAHLGERLEFAHLFPDTIQLVLKSEDDCKATIEARIAKHQAEEQRRAEAAAERERERERIRQEEAAKLRAEQEAAQRAQAPAPTQAPAAAPNVAPALSSKPAAANSPVVVPIKRTSPDDPPIRLGQISDRLGFTVTADFLAQLGYQPVATEKAAKLYRAEDFSNICEALIAHIRTVQAKQHEAIAA